MTKRELIEHCDREMKRFPPGSRIHDEHYILKSFLIGKPVMTVNKFINNEPEQVFILN